MKINEILIESKEQLEEGPILNKIGSAVGKGVGTLAKGVGAVAGGIAGVGSAVKKGYQAAKGVVGAAGDEVPVGPGTAAPAAGAAPAGGGGAAAAAQPAAAPAAAPAASGAPPSAQDINAQGPAGTAPAKAQTGAAGAALAKTTAAIDQQTTDKAGQTVYAQVKANIDKLDKKGKQRILQLLQKSLTAPAAKPAAAAPAAAAPAAAEPAADPAGAGAMGQMAGQLAKGAATQPNTMANAPVSKTNTAKPGNPNAAAAAPAAPAADPAAAKPMEVPGTGKRTRGASRVPKKVALSQAELDAEREARMGPTSDSINRTGNRLAEAFANKVNHHKQRMVAEEIATGSFSFFKK